MYTRAALMQALHQIELPTSLQRLSYGLDIFSNCRPRAKDLMKYICTVFLLVSKCLQLHFSPFSLLVRKYNKSYCSHPASAFALLKCLSFWLKFLGEVFVSLYLLNFFMDQVDTLHVGRCRSEILFRTITTHQGDTEIKVTDSEIFVKVFG